MASKRKNSTAIKIAGFFALIAIIGVSYIAVQNTVSYRSQARTNVSRTPLPWRITPTPPAAPIYYLKTTSWINANPNIASTVVHGCDAGDMSIGGGMDGYTGPINVWRTVRSSPSQSTDMNGWQTTIINEDSVVHQFTLTTKCLKLSP